MYAVVLPPMSNKLKLAIKSSSPLIVYRLSDNTMVEIKKISVKKTRIHVFFFLPRIASKDIGQIEGALSTLMLPAKVVTEKVEEKFCSIPGPHLGTSLSGSMISSTVQARLEKRMPQESMYSERTRSTQNQMTVNPQQED